MKDGRIEKEGTISELKKEQGGFNIKLKLVNRDGEKNNDRNKDGASASKVGRASMTNVTFKSIEELKKFFKQKYNGTIKDEHSVSKIYDDIFSKSTLSNFF